MPEKNGRPESDNNLDFGELVRTEHRALLRFSRQLPCSRHTVWEALTYPSDREAWFPARIEGTLVRDAEIRLRDREPGAHPRIGLVFRVAPREMLGLMWSRAVLVLELKAKGTRACKLELVWAPDNRHQAQGVGAIWHASVDALTCLATNRTAYTPLTERFEQLRAPYTARFGAQHSSIGRSLGIRGHRPDG
ncbi:MAG TPA: hypothetical protein VMD79_03380 [Solirubrobacteraceae bacterium]|nr:hypothetical protein [Solirubrobacteraceae bacterium]